MRCYYAFLTSLCLVVLAQFTELQAADIEVEENPIPVGSFGVAKYKLEKGDAIIWDVSPKPTKMKEYVADGYSVVHFNGPNTKYTVSAFIVNFDTKKFERKSLENVVVSTCAATAPPPDPKKPVDPPVTPTDKYYFLIVRPDGPASPTFTKIMSSPAWDGIKSQGHKIGSATATEAVPLKVNLGGVSLPAVVTLRIAADGKSSTQVRNAIALPTTSEEIAKLPDLK